MALEVEYVDMDTVALDVDPADLVNGDGVSVDDAVQTEPVNQEVEQATGFTPLDVIDPDNTVAALSENLDNINQEDGRRLAEEAHAIEVAAAKEDHFALAVKRSELENDLKEIKADEKAALRNLKNLLKRGPNYPQAKSKIDEAVSAGGERSAIVVDDPNEDQTWRLIPTSTVIDGVKKMGPKKAEAICSIAPTLGDLEELRAKAGIAFKTFKEVLPKGVGSEMADEIEERILTAVAKHKADLVKAASASQTDTATAHSA